VVSDALDFLHQELVLHRTETERQLMKVILKRQHGFLRNVMRNRQVRV